MALPRIRTILVPIDGSKNSTRGLMEAIGIARAFRAKVTVLHVIPGIPSIPITDTMAEYRQSMKKEAREFFLEARKTALQYKTSLTEKVIFGNPQEEIADYANEKKYDLIVIGARGLSSIKQVFLGSVSNATLHKSKMPVLIVR